MRSQTNRIGFYIKVIQNTFRWKLNSILKDYDLTKPQMDILVYLDQAAANDKKVMQKDLETFFHISNPTVSVMLDRLEAKDLIQRKRNEEDRRVRYVVETEKAKEMNTKMRQALDQTEDLMLDGLSDQEIQDGIQFLQKILYNLTGKEDNTFDKNPDEADQGVREGNDSDANSCRS